VFSKRNIGHLPNVFFHSLILNVLYPLFKVDQLIFWTKIWPTSQYGMCTIYKINQGVWVGSVWFTRLKIVIKMSHSKIWNVQLKFRFWWPKVGTINNTQTIVHCRMMEKISRKFNQIVKATLDFEKEKNERNMLTTLFHFFLWYHWSINFALMFHEKPSLPFLLLFPLNFVSSCVKVLHCSWQTANAMSLWNDGVMNGKTCKVMAQQSERCLWHNDGRMHRTTKWKDTVKLCNKKLAQKNDCKVCTKQMAGEFGLEN
jgi:hypothetical protein